MKWPHLALVGPAWFPGVALALFAGCADSNVDRPRPVVGGQRWADAKQ